MMNTRTSQKAKETREVPTQGRDPDWDIGTTEAHTLSHISVLSHELIDGLRIAPDAVVLDGTVNGGGHATAVCAQLGSSGWFVGIDADASAIDRARERLSEHSCRIHLETANFRTTKAVLDRLAITALSAAYFDLGYSSNQLADSGRGFSFERDEPLLMTYTKHPDDATLTARDIVNDWAESDIANVIYGYGEERQAKRIARAITSARVERPIETSRELADVIEQAISRRGKLHPATKTFQALRIAVNDELDALTDGIAAVLAHLAPGGRFGVISFHSLEDRIVKNAFRDAAAGGVGIVCTKKPLTPHSDEIKSNPRSRSAKLRIFEKNHA